MGKRLSDLVNLEIINVFNGDKYGYLGDCEMVFDKITGSIIGLQVYKNKGSIFSFKDNSMIEIPWEDMMKVCEKTIIFDHKI